MTEIAELLMGDPRVDITVPKDDLAMPFLIAHEGGHPAIVRLLLEDPRIDPNLCMADDKSPLHMSAQNGFLDCVKELLAYEGLVEVNKVRISDQKTARDVALWAARRPKWVWEAGEKDRERREVNCPLIAELIASYAANPQEVRKKLAFELGVHGKLPG